MLPIMKDVANLFFQVYPSLAYLGLNGNKEAARRQPRTQSLFACFQVLGKKRLHTRVLARGVSWEGSIQTAFTLEQSNLTRK